MGMILVVHSDGCEAQCAALFGFTNAQQFSAGVGPVDAGVACHMQYIRVIYAQGVLQVVKIVMAINIVFQLGIWHAQQVHAAFEYP